MSESIKATLLRSIVVHGIPTKVGTEVMLTKKEFNFLASRNLVTESSKVSKSQIEVAKKKETPPSEEEIKKSVKAKTTAQA